MEILSKALWVGAGADVKMPILGTPFPSRLDAGNAAAWQTQDQNVVLCAMWN